MNKAILKYLGANTIGLFLVILVNYLAVALPINGKSTQELSEKYSNLFVPAGFTFSIWGIIYLLLIVFVGWQWLQWRKNDVSTLKLINKIGPWFLVSCVANFSWILAWHHELMFISVLIMLVILTTLIKIFLTLQDERPLSLGDRVAIQLPFSVYLGWISVATIANVTTMLVSVDWTGMGTSAQNWAIIMVITATLVGVIAIFKRQDVAFMAVIIWALYGIYAKQSAISSEANDSLIVVVKYCMTLCVIYAILTIVGRRRRLVDAN